MPIAAITVTDSWAEIEVGDRATRIGYASPGVELTPQTEGLFKMSSRQWRLAGRAGTCPRL